MFHWNEGVEIDLRDAADSGMSLVFGPANIKLFKVTNGTTTLFRQINWTS